MSAEGKSNIYSMVRESSENDILVIADGAAFGPEMAYVTSLARFKNVRLFLPESFEWLVLNSSLFNDARTRDILLNPADYIESADFFSWEQFFTKELIEVTATRIWRTGRKASILPIFSRRRWRRSKRRCPIWGSSGSSNR